MFLKGINYDIGTDLGRGVLSRPDYDASRIQREIEVIKKDLHCDAIRISGQSIERLTSASEIALQQGLDVWYSPVFANATQDEASSYLAECANAAERLRSQYGRVVFVVGCEHSIFLKGFVSGETMQARLRNLFNPISMLMLMAGFRRKMHNRLNAYVRHVNAKVRSQFRGKLTYASGTWEKIDWDQFDIVSIDHYRAAFNQKRYVAELEHYKSLGKPVAVTEFGCCSYKGAAEKGPAGWMITQERGGIQVIKGAYSRDEKVQADYIVELLDIFRVTEIHAAFVFTFILPTYRHSPDPRLDLDMASYGIVRPLLQPDEAGYNGLPWAPKKAFHALSKYYGAFSTDRLGTT